MLGGTVMEYIAAEAESPIEKGDFLSFTKREAEIYFNWYIEHIDEAQEIIKHANEYVKQFKNRKRENLISLLVLEKYFKVTGQHAL